MPKRQYTKILITAAGGGAAINCIKSLKAQREFNIDIVAVDSYPYSAGFYLSDKHYLVPKATENGFIESIMAISTDEGVDMILPVHSSEIPIFARCRRSIRQKGVEILISSEKTIETTNNKWKTFRFCAENNISTLRTWKLPDTTLPPKVSFPIYAKPIIGSGTKNHFMLDANQYDVFLNQPSASNYMFQECVVGAQEFTVDVIADRKCNIRALIARERVKVKDGIAVVARSVSCTPFLNSIASIASRLKIIGPFNIQYFKTGENEYKLIEINSRFAAGGLPLATHLGVNLPLLYVKLALGIPFTSYKPDYPTGMTMIKYFEEVFIQS